MRELAGSLRNLAAGVILSAITMLGLSACSNTSSAPRSPAAAATAGERILVHVQSLPEGEPPWYQIYVLATEGVHGPAGAKPSVTLVLTGRVGYCRAGASEYGDRELARLLSQGVRVEVGENDLDSTLTGASLVNGITVVPNGYLRIAELQREGWLYQRW